MVRSAILIAACVALASASVVRQARQGVPELSGPAIPEANRTCTKSGEKCAGAPGFPNVAFVACCDDDLICGTPASIPNGLWGQFCITEDLAVTTSPTTSDADASSSTVDPTASTATGPTTSSGPTTTTGPTSTFLNGSGIPTTIPPTSTFINGSGIPTTTAAATTTTTDDGSVCFPADATVELQGGSFTTMDKLSIGDMVKVGPSEYSRVFMFTHKMSETMHKFVTLETASGLSLSLTKGHYLYVNGALVAAGEVVVGDELRSGSGAADAVVSVTSKVAAGLYNPQTVEGNVVVDGVLASTYTTAVEPTFAHAILSPFRFMNALGLQFTALESGGGALADIAPRGQATF